MTASANTQRNSARDIFAAAVKLNGDAARQTFIALACQGDDNLLAEVQSLLDVDARRTGHALDKVEARLVTQPPALSNATTETFITDSAGGNDSAAHFDVAKHPKIGPYTIRELIGEGGMGYVYVAEQTKPVRRKVALKVIKPGMDTKEVIARFEAERQALAMMSHPNIAKVLDAGTIGDEGQGTSVKGQGTLDPQPLTLGRVASRPYFVMDLVRGEPITKFCDQQKLTTRERLELFLQVCGAVQHAHMKGIIHRDLKPSNVIVELHDVKPVPKVIDFGVAKATGERLTQHTVYTQFSQLVGTPLYMSPEQAKQSALDIDTRSDIYSLGVMLYELLTGTTPFDKQTLSTANITELQRIICEDEPPRPSARISTLKNEQRTTISASRKTEPRELQLSMERELDWIVMKALEKDRTRRYESASAFAADIQRYLDDEPVQACPPTVGYRLRKYARRHKGLLTTATIVLVMLLASTVVSGAFAIQSERDKEAAELAEQAARDSQADAETERETAEQRLEKALEVVDTMLTRVADERLSATPGTAAVREEMLRDALTFYEEFLEDAPGAMEIKRRIADVHFKRAYVYLQLNDEENCSIEFRTALELYEAILTAQPDNLQAIIGVANIRKRATDRFIESAEERLESRWRAVELLEAAFDDHKDGNLFREALTGAYSDQLLTAPANENMERLSRYRDRLEHLLDEWKTISSKKRAEALCAIGSFEQYQLHSSWDVSEAYFRGATQVDEKWDFAFLMLGRCLQARGETEEAEACYWKVLDLEHDWNILNPATAVSANFDSAQINLVDVLCAEGRVQPAIERLSARIASGEAVRRDYLLRADLYLQIGEWAKAAVDLERACQIQKDWFGVGLLVRAYLRNRQYDEAFALLETDVAWSYYFWSDDGARALGWIDFDAVVKGLDAATRRRFLEVLSRAPGQSRGAHRLRARWFLGLGDTERGLGELKELIESRPEELSVLSSVITPALLVNDSGNELRDGMRTLADRAVELNDGSPESRNARAGVLLTVGDWEGARRYIDTLIAGDGPREYYPMYQAALLAVQANDSGRYQELCQQMLTAFADSAESMETQFTAWTCALAPDAVDDYAVPLKLAERAVSTAPENQQYLNSLGAIQLRAGMHEEALATFDKASAVSGDENTSSAYDYYFRALAEHALERTDDARQSLAKANEVAAGELENEANPPLWNRKLTLELLRKEAEGLIGALEPETDESEPPSPEVGER